MVSYDDFYEHYFQNLPLGSVVTVDKDGGPFKGPLIYRGRYYITLQLPYYREGFSVADFYIGHSTFHVEGMELPPLPGHPLPVRRVVEVAPEEAEVDFPGI